MEEEVVVNDLKGKSKCPVPLCIRVHLEGGSVDLLTGLSASSEMNCAILPFLLAKKNSLSSGPLVYPIL